MSEQGRPLSQKEIDKHLAMADTIKCPRHMEIIGRTNVNVEEVVAAAVAAAIERCAKKADDMCCSHVATAIRQEESSCRK